MNNKGLLKRAQLAQKTYSYSDEGDPQQISEFWYQDTIEGKLLFLVLFTQACNYSKCLGCNLPSKMSQNHIDFRDIMMQIDNFFQNDISDPQKKELKKVIVSNNGSVLDEDTFSTTALLYLIAKIKLECPNVEVVCLETRPEYVDLEELEVLSRALIEGDIPAALELAIGFEAFDDKIRNDIFLKGLRISVFEEFVGIIQQINTKFHEKYPDDYKKIKLKAYFMQKPVPGMSEEEAIKDIKQGIDYMHEIAEKYSIDINMHLNPTYVAKGTLLEKGFIEGNFTPPLLASIVESVLHSEGKKVSIYVGLSDEGLAVEGGSFIRKGNTEDEHYVKILEEFNHTQNYSILKI